MKSELRAVLDKIAALRALAAGAATPAEAEAAAAQAAAMIAKYQIDEASVEAHDAGPRDDVREDDEPLWSGPRRIERWRSLLAAGIAQNHGCAFGTRQTKNRTDYTIAGRPSDLAIVRYLFAWLSVEIVRLSEYERGRTARNAFRVGAVRGILVAMERAAKSAESAGGLAMVLVSRHEAALEFMKSAWRVPVTRTVSPKASDRGALARGFHAGRNLNVERDERVLENAAPRALPAPKGAA